MEQHRLNTVVCGKHSKHRGNTLILIIVIALFAVGAVMFINAATQDPTGPVQQCPWVENDRIVDDVSVINLPSKPQIELTEEIGLNLSIKNDEGQSRGRLEILISPDGLVEAIWKAKYKEDDMEKDFSAGLTGNVDAQMLYEDGSSTDDSKLFFLAKGTFILQAFTRGNARAGGGEAYVVGWLEADRSAHGTLVLAPDKKNTKIYTWKRPAPKKRTRKNPQT